MDAKHLFVLMATTNGSPPDFDPASLGKDMEGTSMFQGVALELKRNPGAKNTPPSLDIRLQIPFPCPLTVRSETGLDRMAKKIGLAHEIQSGDPAFDQKYYVECDERSFAVPFLSSSDHRDAAHRLLQEIPQAASVRGDHDGVTLRISPCNKDKFNEAHLAQALPILQKFGSGIPRMPPFPRRIDLRIPVVIIGLILCGVGGVASAVGISKYVMLDNPYVFSLRYSVPAFIAWVVLAYVMLRGRSTALRDFMVLASIAPACFFLLSLGGTMFINCYHDDSPPAEHVAKVTSKWAGSKTYWLSFTSWRGKSGDEKMQVKAAEYNTVKEKDCIRVVTREGRLGLVWIVSWGKKHPC